MHADPGEGSAGRYEVAVDSLLDFRIYPQRGMAPGQQPWIERMKEATESRDPVTIAFEGWRFTWHPGSGEVLPVVTVPIEIGRTTRRSDSRWSASCPPCPFSSAMG